MQKVLDFFGGNLLPAETWWNKYRSKKLGETHPNEMWTRIQFELAQAEQLRNKKIISLIGLSNHGQERFSKLVGNTALPTFIERAKRYLNFEGCIPGGSGLQGIGDLSIYTSLSNCFVLESPEDCYAGINFTASEIAEIGKRRGGSGTDISTIRPAGAIVDNQAKTCTGPVFFAEKYSAITKEVAQDGRRGALMLTMKLRHPDSVDFIKSKQDLTKLTGCNISVLVDNEFMNSLDIYNDLKNTVEYIHCFPCTDETASSITQETYDSIRANPGTLVTQKQEDGSLAYFKLSFVHELWNTIIDCAHNTAEPGVIFEGNWEQGPDYFYPEHKPVSTNPCVSGDTPILTDTGYYPIRDLVGKKVNIWNGKEWSEVEPKVTGENQEMLKITLSNGKVIRCTKYHKWFIHEGFNRDGKTQIITADKIKINDKIAKFNLPVLNFEKSLDDCFAYSQGFYSGDGTTDKNSARLYGEKIKLANFLHGKISDSGERENHYGTKYVNFIFNETMFSKDFVPINYSIKTKLNWLAGLIDADGCSDSVGACQIASTNKAFLTNVSYLLETIGIQTNINHAKQSGFYDMPDQKGGLMSVECNDCYRILIRTLDIKKLIELGLKTNRVKFNYNSKRNASRFITIKNIEEDGIDEKVYCFNEPKKHAGIFNGILLGNCSEIPMPPFDACRLFSTNCYSFVDNPFTEHATLNTKKVYDFFYEQLVYCDLLIDLEEKHINNIMAKNRKNFDNGKMTKRSFEFENTLWTNILKKAKAGRRCGAGFLAIGDMIAGLNIEYSKSVEINQELFQTKFKAELDATIDLAILFGKFEGYDPKIELKSDLIRMTQKEFPDRYERMVKYGRRNVSWSTGAPTGSLAILTQTTSGIEPLFLPYYTRRKKCTEATDRVDYIDVDGSKFTEYNVVHPKFVDFFKNSPNVPLLTKEEIENLPKAQLDEYIKKSPYYNNTANDIDYKVRIEIQAIIQKYTTHAISSTINLPETIDKETVSQIYIQSHKMGLKGNTIYRDNCRGGVLIKTKTDKTENSENVINCDVELVLHQKRPTIINGDYYNFKIGKNFYNVIVGLINNKPYEIFIIKNKELLELLDDKISGKVVKITSNDYEFIAEFESVDITIRDITQMEDDEKLLSLMLSSLMASNMPIEKITKLIDKSMPIAGNLHHRLIKILKRYENSDSQGDCPHCKQKMINSGGCILCPHCGWSKC